MPDTKDVRSTNRQADGPSPLTDRPTDATQPSRTEAERRHQQRSLVGALIGALVALFALLNLNDVKVH